MNIKNMAASATVAMMCLAMVAACDMETSGNGDLDGLWHLRGVDTLATGGYADLSGNKIYWAVQGDLLILDDKSDTYESIVMYFDHSGDTLRLYSPYIYDRSDGDPEIENIDQLRPYGVNSTDESFFIERLSGSRMILSTDTLQLNFKKI